VGLQPLGQKFGEDVSGAGGREDGIQGRIASGTVVGMIEITVSVVADGGVRAEDDVRPIAADDPGEVSAQGQAITSICSARTNQPLSPQKG